MNDHSVRIYDDNLTLLWDSADYSDIVSDNTEIIPIVVGPLQWQTWSESNQIKFTSHYFSKSSWNN